MSNELNVLKEYILEKNKEKAEQQMKKVRDNWKERYKVLAYYIEHDDCFICHFNKF